MKHLLINEACFITSNVNDKKFFSTAAAFKKVRLHPMFLALSKQMELMSLNDITVKHCTAHLMKTRKLKNY